MFTTRYMQSTDTPAVIRSRRHGRRVTTDRRGFRTVVVSVVNAEAVVVQSRRARREREGRRGFRTVVLSVVDAQAVVVSGEIRKAPLWSQSGCEVAPMFRLYPDGTAS